MRIANRSPATRPNNQSAPRSPTNDHRAPVFLHPNIGSVAFTPRPRPASLQSEVCGSQYARFPRNSDDARAGILYWHKRLHSRQRLCSKLKRIGDPQISPDARWVAFTVTTVDVEKNTKPRQIWPVPLAGGAPKQITTEGKQRHAALVARFEESSLSCSTRGNGGSSQIWMMNHDGHRRDAGDQTRQRGRGREVEPRRQGAGLRQRSLSRSATPANQRQRLQSAIEADGEEQGRRPASTPRCYTAIGPSGAASAASTS